MYGQLLQALEVFGRRYSLLLLPLLCDARLQRPDGGEQHGQQQHGLERPDPTDSQWAGRAFQLLPAPANQQAYDRIIAATDRLSEFVKVVHESKPEAEWHDIFFGTLDTVSVIAADEVGGGGGRSAGSVVEPAPGSVRAPRCTQPPVVVGVCHNEHVVVPARFYLDLVGAALVQRSVRYNPLAADCQPTAASIPGLRSDILFFVGRPGDRFTSPLTHAAASDVLETVPGCRLYGGVVSVR